MVLRYNSLKKPNPRKWLSASEFARIKAVLKHHADEPDELPNKQLHASIHFVVENQCALGDETPVSKAIQRLMNEGLDRHDAVHA
ncbi:MAG: hypothetical protein K8R59_10400, partial [Thermoanaerobaculales bacterium]|nr:hypothetical protein [Thermoanaerobaculales bacterium]